MTAAPAPPLSARTRPATPAQLDWLAAELPHWRSAGLVDDRAATAILASYHPTRRFDLSSLLLTLGAAFVGVGIIWLVASNLDQLPPLTRFLVVAAFWLAFLAGGELLAGRREHGGTIPSPVVGAVRILAALTFGAVVFQAAQSLQVPAYEPQLLAWWGLGALVHAYVVRATGPLVVGLVAGASWLVWQTTWDVAGRADRAARPLRRGCRGRVPRRASRNPAGASFKGFSAAWREVGAAALPRRAVHRRAALRDDRRLHRPRRCWSSSWSRPGWPSSPPRALATGNARLEPAMALVIGAVGVLLVLWEVGSDFDVDDQVGAAGWAHAALGVIAYVGAAAWFAVLGVLRDSKRLTFIATAALVVFTTFQAFAVFAAIVQGAWLFVLLGLVFAGTGWLADRARRQLARSLGDDMTDGADAGDDEKGTVR